MSWKNRSYPALTFNSSLNTKIISHSISPHEEPTFTKTPMQTVHHVPYEQNRYGYQTKHWDKYQCETEIEILKQKGYTIGRDIITTYNNPGKIKKYRDIPENGLDFSGKYPNLLVIERHNLANMDNLYFNEEELTFLHEASNDC